MLYTVTVRHRSYVLLLLVIGTIISALYCLSLYSVLFCLPPYSYFTLFITKKQVKRKRTTLLADFEIGSTSLPPIDLL